MVSPPLGRLLSQAVRALERSVLMLETPLAHTIKGYRIALALTRAACLASVFALDCAFGLALHSVPFLPHSPIAVGRILIG